MIQMKINGCSLSVAEGTTILQAARENGFPIPTLCYLKEINEVAACRICLVEVVGEERLYAACNSICTEGMEILTNSKRVIEARRNNLALILSKHDSHCTTCERNGNCTLQDLSRDFNLNDDIYEPDVPANDWDRTLPLIRNNSKCIGCLRCINICDKVQSMKVWDLLGTGAHARVGVRGGQKITDVNCTYCGQCITHCPVGALTERNDIDCVLDAIHDPEKIVVLQVAPAVRAAWGDALGLPAEFATEKRMAAAFRALGVDYVFDTNFTADLTIMEEGNEFLYKMTHPESFRRPLFTSCCPGWVRFMKLEYPEYVSQLSTAKSPQQMFGAVAKTYFADKIGVDGKKIFSVSIMPCTAKKYECGVDAVNDAGVGRDVDAVLTTREVCKLMKVKGIDPKALPEEEFDSPLGTGSGAAVIFGATGGVMEAALRTAYYVLVGQNPDADAFAAVRGLDGRRELTANIKGIPVRACIASGLANARAVMEDIRTGKKTYDFVEIMACPGGCAGGGGQPIADGCELAGERGQRLYDLDAANSMRFSHENPDVIALYKEYMGEPLSHKAHELLHTDQTKWDLDPRK